VALKAVKRHEDVPRRFFFVHVMKTAGTTFAFQVKRTFREDEIYPVHADLRHENDNEPYTSIGRLQSLSIERLEKVRLFMGHFPYVACELAPVECVPLTILREPFARTISALNHFARLPKYLGRSPEEIYEDAQVFRVYVENHQTKVFSATSDTELWPSDEPMVIDAERFAAAKNNLAKVAVIGFTEQYDAFIEGLRERFGWWPGGVDLHARVNVSEKQSDISPELRRRIIADNHFDFELYEHARQLTAARNG
jgi:Sulfotransferase family